MNELSVDVPFVENEEKKNKKPNFLDDGFDDKIKKEELNDKGEKEEEIEKKEEEKEKEKEENEEKKEEEDNKKKEEEEKIQILNNIINNEPKDEDIEIEQLEEFQI